MDACMPACEYCVCTYVCVSHHHRAKVACHIKRDTEHSKLESSATVKDKTTHIATRLDNILMRTITLPRQLPIENGVAHNCVGLLTRSYIEGLPAAKKEADAQIRCLPVLGI